MTQPVLDIQFTGGIDQSTREELVDATTSFTNLTNIRKSKQGGADKRPGFASLGATRFDGTTRSAGCKLAMNGNQICTIDGTFLDVRDHGSGRFSPRQRVPDANYSFFEVPTLGTSAVVTDCIVVGNYTIIAHRVSTAGLGTTIFAYASIFDSATGTTVRGPEKIDNSVSVDDIRLATYGNIAILLFGDESSHILRGWFIDLSSPATITTGWAATTPANITTSFTGNALAVANVPSLNDRIAVAFSTNSGTNRVTVITMTAAALIDTITINTSSLTPSTLGGLDLSEASGTLWVAWNEGFTAKICGLDPNAISSAALASTLLAIDVTPTTIQSVTVASRASTTASILVQCANFLTTRNVKTTAGAAVGDGAATTGFNATIQSRPILRNSRLYAMFSSLNGDDIALCDWTPTSGGSGEIYLRPVVVPVVRGLFTTNGRPRCRIANVGSNVYTTAISLKRTGTSFASTGLKFDFASPNRWQNAEHRNSLYFGGGLTCVFDGVKLFESGFLCAPPIPIVDVSAAGGQSFTVGRSYVAVYAQADADGNLHLSGVSIPNATGIITSKTVTISVYPLSITARDGGSDALGWSLFDSLLSNIKIFLFATNDGGTTYHLIDSKTSSSGSGLVVFTDGASELSVTGGALLYGSGNLPGTIVGGQIGGPQDHRAPPGLSFVTSFNGTLVGASNNEVWQSSQPVYGEGAWWSPIFSAQFNEQITGLATLGDGTLVVFTRRRIYILTGSPPNDAGTAGGLDVPRVLPVDVGCANANSIVVTSLGVFFQSDRTYELFSGGANLIPIGFQIQDELDAFPIVTSAVVDSRNALVRITLASALDVNGFVTGTGRDLIFDLQLQTWMSSDRKFGSSADQASQDAAMIRYNTGAGDEWRYGWLAANGVLYGERGDADAAVSLDGATWATQSATTSWIHIAGIQGEQFIDRIIFLAKQVSNHDFLIELAFNYADFSSSKPFTAAEINTLAREWLDREVIQTESQAIRIRITDVTPSSGAVGTGQGATWVALTVSGQPHRGAKRTSGPQRGSSP